MIPEGKVGADVLWVVHEIDPDDEPGKRVHLPKKRQLNFRYVRGCTWRVIFLA